MLVSIGIVYSTSASRICFVGDTPAKIGVLTLRSSWRLDILSVLFLLLTRWFQVLKSFPQDVLSSKARDMLRRLFSFCVYYTLCEKCGSDAYTIHRSIARYFACSSKTVSHWMLQRWYFHGLSLLVFIQRHFTELNYRFLFRQAFQIPTSQVTLKWLTTWRCSDEEFPIVLRGLKILACFLAGTRFALLRKNSDARDKISASATIIEKQHLEEIYFYLTFSIRCYK